jgi:FkbM family methyltransferase
MKRVLQSALAALGYQIMRVGGQPSVAVVPNTPVRRVTALRDGEYTRADASNATLRHLLNAQVSIDWERVLESVYRRLILPGHVVVDIGAHSGLHTAVFLELVGKDGQVHAFEPIPHLAAALGNRLGQPATLTVTAAAVSEQAGKANFKFARNAPQESGLRERIFNAPNPDVIDIEVDVHCLDDYCDRWPRVDYIKIDIEGGEIGCLKGAKKLLASRRPILSVEYGAPSYSQYGHTRASLFEWASANDYVMADLFGNRILTLDEWDRLCDTVYWDFFMFPRERAEAIESQLLNP